MIPQMRIPSALHFALPALFLSGCAAPRTSPTPDTLVNEPVGASSDRMWAAAQETLRRQLFRIDRLDRSAGVMTSFPETSAQFFEFWRSDVATARDAFESSLNPIRRWVEVSLAEDTDTSLPALAVIVHKERLSAPDRQFNSTGAAYQFFGDSLPSTTGQPRVTPQDDRWIDLGRDAAMEARLRGLILRRAGIPMETGAAVP